jgi:menaquinone-specific isochorismate synthase
LRSKEHIGLERNGSLFDVLPARARWLLADRVSRALSEAVSDPAEQVVRLTVPVERVEPLRWLRHQSLLPKLCWSARGGEGGFAAVGVADVQEGGVSESADRLCEPRGSLLSSGDRQARYYGGLRFDPLREPDAQWKPFGAYRFVLPRFELQAGDRQAALVCNLVLPRDARRHSEILNQIERLSLSQDTLDDTLPEQISRMDCPDEREWRGDVERALSAFSEGRLGKLVLARQTELGFAR